MGYTHIEESERRRIERAIESGKGVREIARMIGRSPSSVSEEISRNSVRKKYTRQRAESKSRLRRKQSKLQCMKVAMDPALKEYVIEKMKEGWSPELIAGRLKQVDTHIASAGTNAIYKFVHSVHGRLIEKHLYSKVHRRRGGAKRGARKVKLDGRTMIDQRPSHIQHREEFGHFEGDFMESGRDGSGSLLHIVERKTRYPFLEKVSDRTTSAINRLVETMLAGVDPLSLTLDNDLSFAKHIEMSALLNAPIYFCNPYHSWEKGTVENRNRAVRLDIPKGTDNATVSDERLKEIEKKLRNRPMAVLGFKTPQEAWDIEMEKRENQKKIVEKKDARIISLAEFTRAECSA